MTGFSRSCCSNIYKKRKRACSPMGSNVSSFQDSVGKGTADLQVAFSPVIVVILIIAAVVFAVMALTPMKFVPPGPPSSNFPCGPNEPCLNSQEVCDNGYCHRVVVPPNGEPKTHPMLLIGTAVCLGLAFVVVPLSRKLQQIVYSNKNASIAAGTFTEADILGNLLRR